MLGLVSFAFLVLMACPFLDIEVHYHGHTVCVDLMPKLPPFAQAVDVECGLPHCIDEVLVVSQLRLGDVPNVLKLIWEERFFANRVLL